MFILIKEEFCMLKKKLTALAALLALASAAAFAQVTIGGTVQYDLNGTTTIEKDKDPNSNAESDLLDNSNVVIGFAKDAISGNVIVRTAGIKSISGLFDFRAAWKINDLLALNAAYSWLPGAFWSGLSFDGDVNAVLGASAIGRTGYLRLNIDRAYVGFWADEVKSPGFFVGYDYRAQSFSAGTNLTGTYQAEKEIFSLAASLHGTVNFGPAGVRVNLAIYKDGNEFSGALTPLAGAAGEVTDKPFLEGLVEFDYTLGAATVVLTAAYGRNLDSGADTLQAGLAVPIQIAAGFKVIPGLIFKSTLSDGSTSDNAVSTIKYGASLAYSF
jgi:predicted porin